MTTALHTTAPSGHIPAIDGLRGLAVLLVVIAHTILMKPTCWLDEQVASLLGVGWCGVDLFFVLSGFLITGILYDAKGGRNYFTSFYIRRSLRIFPVYYLALVLLLVVLPRIGIPQADAYRSIAEHQSWFWFHFSNFHFAQMGFTGDATDVFWSLAIEEQFYLLWPLVIWFGRRRPLMITCVCLIIAAFAARIGMTLAGAKPVAIYVLPFTRMDGLAAGGLIALMARGPVGIKPWLLIARYSMWISLIGLALMALLSGGLPIWARNTQIFGISLFTAFFTSLLVLILNTDTRTVLPRVFEHRFLCLFGRYSYAIYISHLPVRMVLRTAAFDLHQFPKVAGSSLPGQLLFTIATIGLSLLMAIASWHLLEKHALKLKRLFPYHSTQLKAPNAPLPSPEIGWPHRQSASS